MAYLYDQLARINVCLMFVCDGVSVHMCLFVSVRVMVCYKIVEV